jgi:hypothetical protein
LVSVDLSHKIDKRVIEQRRNDFANVVLVVGVDLGCDLQANARTLGNLDGAIWTLSAEIRPKNNK